MQNNGRIEVITNIESMKVVESDKYEGMLTVLFNQGNLVPFMYDGKAFYVESVEEEASKKFIDKKEKEEAKLNRPKTEVENAQDAKAYSELERVLEEIKVIYRKDPISDPIDLTLYVKEITGK